MVPSKQKKHYKNTSDSRISITAVRCGNTADENGPVVFIASGQNMNSMFSKHRLKNTYSLPEGSTILTNDSAYMDDATWLRCVEVMAPGIRVMLVIRDHPDWWVCLTLDGFKSHVNVDEALKKFASVKIRIVKEEAGTSHVNQPYDQETAQANQRSSRQL